VVSSTMTPIAETTRRQMVGCQLYNEQGRIWKELFVT
jgi:hypothetical protein